MNVTAIAARLESFGSTFSGIARIATDADARWKPPTGAWSILEIVCHLADEEVHDFRTRLRLTLESPGTPWPPMDPEGWAVERRYNDQSLTEQVERFVRERAESVRWLRSLKDADWSAAYVHPKFGPIKAGTLLVSWAAHDALHMRQIAKRLYELAGREGVQEQFETRYAGEWGP